MKVHITGGAGFVGSHLADRLVDAGHDVAVFDNVSRGGRDRLEGILDEIRFVEGDVRDRDAFADAVDDPDVLFHLAAINGTKHFYDRPRAVLDVNLEGVKHATQIAAEQDIDRLVFASSSEVYGFPETFPTPETHPLQLMDPTNPRYSYAGTKILGEQYVIQTAAAHEFAYTIVRPHNFYGEAMGYDHVIPEFIERLVTGSEFSIYGDGTQTRSFCYIDDGVDAIERAGFADAARDEIINVGTQDEITINELASALFDVTGRRPEVTHIESKELSGSPDRRLPDLSKARDLLGYEPTTSLETGLRRTFEYYYRDLTGNELEQWES